MLDFRQRALGRRIRRATLDPGFRGEGALLVLSPHADDDVLGCGGTMALARRAGSRVRVVTLTDGTGSHPGVNPDELRDLREEESRTALGILGVAPEDAAYWRLGDGQLESQLAEARELLHAELDRHPPDRIFVPDRSDHHPDHRATFEVAAGVLGKRDSTCELLEYPLWHWDRWPFTRSERRQPLARLRHFIRGWRGRRRHLETLDRAVDVREVLEMKREAIRAHRSQVSARTSRELGSTHPALEEIRGGSFLECFLTGYEFFRTARPAGRDGITPSGEPRAPSS